MGYVVTLGLALLLALCLYALALKKFRPQNTVKARVQGLQKAGTFAGSAQWEAAEAEPTFRERVVVPFFQRLEDKIVQLTPSQLRAVLELRIMYAGKQYVWSTETFACALVLSAGVFASAAFWFVFYLNHMGIMQGMVILLAAVFVGASMPIVFLDSLIAKRRQQILRQLPEVLDLLCVSVQAGLSFDGAMSKLAAKMKGPFIDECDKMLRDVRVGMPRRKALVNLVKRCHVQEVQLFIAAVIQSERLGVSMGKTLTIQSENMRERRRQALKAAALKAPIKMLFPLAVFIFPVLFAVLLFPAVMTMIQSMGVLQK